MTNEKYFKSRFSFDPKRDKIWEVIAGYLQREIREDRDMSYFEEEK